MFVKICNKYEKVRFCLVCFQPFGQTCQIMPVLKISTILLNHPTFEGVFSCFHGKKIHNRLWHIQSVYTIGCVRDQRTSMFPVLDTNLCTFLSCYLVIDFLRTPKFFVCSDPQRLQLGSGQCRLFDLHQLRLLTEFQVRQRYLVILHNEKRSSRCE